MWFRYWILLFRVLELEFRVTVRLNLTKHRARVGIASVSYSGGPRFEYFFFSFCFSLSSVRSRRI